MKKLYAVAGLFMVAGGVGSAEEAGAPTEVIQSQETKKSGREAVESLRKRYEAGEYQDFLEGLEADHSILVEDGRIQEFIQIREIAPTNETLEELANQWEMMHQKLVDERNSALLKACEGHADLGICGLIESLTTKLSQEQRDALRSLSTLRFKTPDTASSEDEKALIQIDLAAEFKAVHLDAQHAVQAIQDRNDKQIVIKMDMLKQMQAAAQSFQDEQLKNTVDLAAGAYDAWQAQSLDWKDVYQRVKTPANDTERKVSSILNDYKNQREDLYQKEFLAKVDQ